MSTLDATLRASTRQVKGITIWRTIDNRWQVSMTFDGTGWVSETDADMPTALAALLRRYRGDTAETLRNRLTTLLEGEALRCG